MISTDEIVTDLLPPSENVWPSREKGLERALNYNYPTRRQFCSSRWPFHRGRLRHRRHRARALQTHIYANATRKRNLLLSSVLLFRVY